MAARSAALVAEPGALGLETNSLESGPWCPTRFRDLAINRLLLNTYSPYSNSVEVCTVLYVHIQALDLDKLARARWAPELVRNGGCLHRLSLLSGVAWRSPLTVHVNVGEILGEGRNCRPCLPARGRPPRARECSTKEASHCCPMQTGWSRLSISWRHHNRL